MTPITWPASLPCLRWEPYGVAPRPGSLEETLGMVTNLSRVYTQNNEVVTCDVVLDATDEPTFRTFYKTTLAMGTQWFNTEILRNGVYESYEVCFIGAPPVFTPIAHNVVKASFTLLTRGIALDEPPPPEPFACEAAGTSSYLVSPAWTTYPTGIALNTSTSAPYSVSPTTGRVTFITNRIEEVTGESPRPPQEVTALFTTYTYEHIGTFLSAGSVSVEVQRPSAGVWGNVELKKFNIGATPIQFSAGLFIVNRNGYSGLGGSSWFSTGVASDAGYHGDFNGYSPSAYAGVGGGGRGAEFETARAKYFNDNTYLQIGSAPGNPTTTLSRISTPGGGLPPSIGTTYSGDQMFDTPTSRVFSSAVRDVACDQATGYIYVLYGSTTIERIDPETLATIDTWTGSFAQTIDGISVSGSRVVLAPDNGGFAGSHYWVVDLNGSGGMDTVHVGANEIDPSGVLSGTYVWADPVCGFLKQKNRWISGIIGP